MPLGLLHMVENVGICYTKSNSWIDMENHGSVGETAGGGERIAAGSALGADGRPGRCGCRSCSFLSRPQRVFTGQTEIDDREANLQTFWRTVVQKKWSLQHWASLLAPFLSGAVLNQDWN